MATNETDDDRAGSFAGVANGGTATGADNRAYGIRPSFATSNPADEYEAPNGKNPTETGAPTSIRVAMSICATSLPRSSTTYARAPDGATTSVLGKPGTAIL